MNGENISSRWCDVIYGNECVMNDFTLTLCLEQCRSNLPLSCCNSPEID